MINITLIEGHLTANPETRKVGDGTVTTFSVASNQRWKNDKGEKMERVDFVEVECWDGLATVCAENLTKGRHVLVQGKIRQDRWEDKESGGKRSRILIRADTVQFLDRPKDAGAGAGAAAAQDEPPY